MPQVPNGAAAIIQDGDPRTIDVHVAWLRAKLGSDPDRPARLVTVRGIGYRLDLEPA